MVELSLSTGLSLGRGQMLTILQNDKESLRVDRQIPEDLRGAEEVPYVSATT